MKKVSELRQRAERSRRLKRYITDSLTTRAICELEDELEMTADQLEQRHWIRERAHAIWVAQGRPEGRDMENWLTAEREQAQTSERSESVPEGTRRVLG